MLSEINQTQNIMWHDPSSVKRFIDAESRMVPGPVGEEPGWLWQRGQSFLGE